MRTPSLALTLCLLALGSTSARAQVDEDQLGAWYMAFFNKTFETSRFGWQGEVQYRNWDYGGDLEQLLLRGGATWRPDSVDMTVTLGYGNITSGAFGASDDTTGEHRSYQEALIPQQLGERVFLRHRFRYEQRWVEDQDFRTRYRYALFVDVPLNQASLSTGAWYVALYNEIFINGQKDIGGGRSVERYDRNRTYGALGYSLRDNLRVQGGYMHQHTDAVGKGQLQLSLHHSF